ncbi:MAG TPA: nickel-dependent lactate racemase [Anaerolineae bacterium]|nr:nickel-dependent lactate racemase [Anaerolineae bacterium]
MRIRLAYGKSGLWVDLPDGLRVQVIEPRATPGLSDEPAAIRAALRAPMGTPPLRSLAGPADSVAVVFSDLTRPMPNDRVLPVLLEELASAGVPDDKVVLVNALGTHRAQTESELEGMLGRDVTGRYRVVQHDAGDDSCLVEVTHNHTGRPVRINRAYLDASVRILTGFVEPHFFAGFSGGPKAVLPGIADQHSILENHGTEMIAHPNARWMVTDGNPIWEEMLGVALAARPTFLLNVSLNAQRKVTGVFAGDLVKAHRAAVGWVRAAATCLVDDPFDIVITSNSGYPLDLNLYQAVKGMSAAEQVVRQGGDIIVAAECWDGIPSHGEYRRLLWQAASPRDLLDRVLPAAGACQDRWEAQIQAQVQGKAIVHLYADGLTEDEVRSALLVPCRSIEATVASILAKKDGATAAVLPDGPQAVPVLRVLGRGRAP